MQRYILRDDVIYTYVNTYITFVTPSVLPKF